MGPTKILSTTRVISLGHSCVPSYYIRKWCNQPEAYPFDWLVVPADTLIKLLYGRIDVEVIFNNLEVHEQPKPGKSHIPIINKELGVYFYHEFTPVDWQAQIPKVKEKYNFLWARLAETLITKQIVFIRHHIKINECRELVGALDHICKPGFKLITVNECPPEPGWDFTNVQNLYIKESPQWCGDEKEWRKVFTKV